MVERWNPFAKVRQDLFGVIDIVAMNVGGRVISLRCVPPLRVCGIQATSAANVSSRVSKILAEPRAVTWVKCGGGLVVHGWGKLKGWKKPGVRVVRLELVRNVAGERLEVVSDEWVQP